MNRKVQDVEFTHPCCQVGNALKIIVAYPMNRNANIIELDMFSFIAQNLKLLCKYDNYHLATLVPMKTC